MKQDRHIEQQVEETMNSLDTLHPASPDEWFASKVMARWERENQVQAQPKFWLRPSFQLAALACMLLLNLGGIILNNQSQRTQQIDNLAQQYELTKLNQNETY